MLHSPGSVPPPQSAPRPGGHGSRVPPLGPPSGPAMEPMVAPHANGFEAESRFARRLRTYSSEGSIPRSSIWTKPDVSNASWWGSNGEPVPSPPGVNSMTTDSSPWTSV